MTNPNDLKEEKFDELKKEFVEAETNYNQFITGYGSSKKYSKAAAVRLRKNMQKIKVLAQVLREEVQIMLKSNN